MKIASAASESKLYDLSIFHDVAKALTSSLDLDVILEILMQKMAAYFEPATWALVMLDESSRQPQYVAPVEPEFQRLNEVRLKTEQSAGRAGSSRPANRLSSPTFASTRALTRIRSIR